MSETADAALAEALTKHKAGHLDEARNLYLEILSRFPGTAEAEHLLGVIAAQKNDPTTAAGHFQKAIKLDNRQAKYFLNLGNMLLQIEEHEESLSAFLEAERLDPTLKDAIAGQAMAQMNLGRFRAAEQTALLGLDGGFRSNIFFNLLASALGKQNKIEEALAICREGRTEFGFDATLATTQASLEELSNNLSSAQKTVEEICQKAPENKMALLMLARILRRKKQFDQAHKALLPLVGTPMSLLDNAEVHHELGMILDGMESYDEAFEAFRKSNMCIAATPPAKRCSPEAYTAVVKEYKNAASAPLPDLVFSDAERTPNFFVGFPRSGTTLMEQILGAHQDVLTTGEMSPLEMVENAVFKIASARNLPLKELLQSLSDGDIRELRKIFWRQSETLFGNTDSLVLLDKLPLNITRVKLIDALWPKAKVIVALRDPRDVCVSNFIQRFGMTNAMSNFLDIEKTGRLYRDVMELWLETRSQLRLSWMEYKYEDLVADFKGTVDKALDFLELGWCEEIENYREQTKQKTIHTPSYRNVTEKISSKAIGRWKRYEKHLAPILPVLQPYVKAFGYAN